MRNRDPFNDFDRKFNRMGRLIKVWFVFIAILMVAGAFWQYSMYQDCRNHGNAAYQCSAMLSGDQHYVAVDNVTRR